MSRDRPTVLPRPTPDATLGAGGDQHPSRSSGADIDRLKKMSGPGILAGHAVAISRKTGGKPLSPQFLRPGYEGAIRENLNDTLRGRGWRRKSTRSGATRKEILQARRRRAAKSVL